MHYVVVLVSELPGGRNDRQVTWALTLDETLAELKQMLLDVAHVLPESMPYIPAEEQLWTLWRPVGSEPGQKHRMLERLDAGRDLQVRECLQSRDDSPGAGERYASTFTAIALGVARCDQLWGYQHPARTLLNKRGRRRFERDGR